jgi:hypothetical protein
LLFADSQSGFNAISAESQGDLAFTESCHWQAQSL